jgi:pyrophosphatase PpaX
MPQRPIAILFDLDGTLIDSIPLLLSCVHHAFEGFGGPVPTDAEWIQGIGTPLAKQMAAYTQDPAEVERLTGRYRAYQREHHDALTAVYPGVLDVIRTLHQAGHPMGIVTSNSNGMMDRALDFVGIAPYMATAIGADSCHLHKPDPFPVRLALQNLGYQPEEAIFVGDSPHDVNSGNAASVATIAALWGPFTRTQLESAKPTFYLDAIVQLPALVQRIQAPKLV